MRNESSGLRIVALGALNGIIFGTLLETVLRSIFVYEKYQRSLRPPSGFSISYLPYPFEWWFLPLSFFVCVAFATLITHQLFGKRIKSPVWFWQIVGIVVGLNNALFITSYTFYLWYSEYGLEYPESMMSQVRDDLFMLLVAYPLIAAFSLLFALVLKRRKLNFS